MLDNVVYQDGDSTDTTNIQTVIEEEVWHDCVHGYMTLFYR